MSTICPVSRTIYQASLSTFSFTCDTILPKDEDFGLPDLGTFFIYSNEEENFFFFSSMNCVIKYINRSANN